VSEKETTQPKEEPKEEPKKDTTLVFTGDIMPYDSVLNIYRSDGIDGIVGKSIQNVLKNADITMVNQEFPFSTRGTKAPDKQFTFRIHPSHVTLMQDLGVDIVSLANNHSLDFGPDALNDTFDTLDKGKIRYAGAGASEERARELQILEKNGKKFGFLASSRVIPVSAWDVRYNAPGVFTTYDPQDLLEDINAAKSECEFLTVFIHWGIERAERPEAYQITMAKQYIDAGADLVIGSHPHVLQGFEFYKGKPIVYSLGNFIFNTSIPSTVALKVQVKKDNRASLKIVPAKAVNGKTQEMKDSEKRELYKYLQGISNGISIKRGKIDSDYEN
ncbi:MAG: CapA family protein, partial [Lachnospiraceae bacterium]